MRYGIIGALDEEIALVKEQMTEVKEHKLYGRSFYTGRIGKKEIVLVCCGVGKVNAAVCTQTMILKYSPELIINSGVAGGLEPTLRVCDIVVARDVVQHDMDTSPLGDPVGFISGIDIINIPCNEDKTEQLCRAVEENGIRCLCGTIASGDVFVADPKKKSEIVSRFGAYACEMEGGAIGHVCYRNGVPFCVIRSISDNADDSSPLSYTEFVRIAADNLVSVIKTFFERL